MSPKDADARGGPDRPAFFTRPFALLCVAMFLGYGNQWALMPLIPLYVKELGGTATLAGLAILAFSVPSFTIRPFVGMIADRWSAAGVLVIGLALLAAGSSVFLAGTLAAVFLGGIVRGVGWSGLNTGGYTTLAHVAPAERRGEAAGYYTAVMACASSTLPAIALWLVEGSGGFPLVFALSALLAAAGLPVAIGLARASSRVRPPAGSGAPAGMRGLIDRGVLISTGLNLSSTLAMPAAMAFMPLYARSLGIEHIGFFYVLAGVTSIVARPLLGRKSDAMGRGPAIALGLAAQLAGLACIAAAGSLPLILVGGVLVALASSLVGSATTALAMDLANPASRGQAMATYSISFQIGSGIGAIIAGALADLVSLRGMYAGSIVIVLAGLALLAWARRHLPRKGG